MAIKVIVMHGDARHLTSYHMISAVVKLEQYKISTAYKMDYKLLSDSRKLVTKLRRLQREVHK